MSRRRALSALEAPANALIGCCVAIVAHLVMVPVVGLQAMPWQPLAIGLAFMAISAMRGCVLRRRSMRSA